MAKLLKVKCPSCAGPLKIQPNIVQVTCEYCGHTSLVQQKGQAPPPRTPQTVNFGVIDAGAAAEKARKAVIIMVVVFSGLPVVIIAIVVASVMGAVSSATSGFNAGDIQKKINNALGGANTRSTRGNTRAQTEANKAIAQAMAKVRDALKRVGAKAPPAAAPAPSAKSSGALKLKVKDPRRVDGLEIMAQARMAALQVNKHVKLRDAHFPRVTNGVVDTTRPGSVAYIKFKFRYQDKTKPPGEDIVKGGVYVSLTNGEFKTHRSGIGGRDRKMPWPQCDMRTMWKNVVASGVPANAIATVYYYRDGFRARGVWSVRVKDHSEYQRTVRGESCRVKGR